jgi:tetratricopeptide (TPR) repeat protein
MMRSRTILFGVWAAFAITLIGLWTIEPLGTLSRPSAAILIGLLLALFVLSHLALHWAPLTDRDYRRALHLDAEGMTEEAIALYTRLIARLRRDAANHEIPMRVKVLERCLYNRGVALREIGRASESLASMEELIVLCGARSDLASRTYIAKALLSKDLLLQALGDTDGANVVSGEVFDRFADASEPSLRAFAAIGLLHKGAHMSKAGRLDEAIQENDRLIARFGKENDWSILGVVADAMCNKAKELHKSGETSEAIQELERVVDVFEDRIEAIATICRALADEGAMLDVTGDRVGAVSSYGRAIRLGAGSERDEVRTSLAGALFGQGNSLRALGRTQEALAAYDQAIDAYMDLPQAAVEVTKAMTNRVDLLLDLGRCEDALSGCAEIRKRVDEARDDCERHALDVVAWVERQCTDSGRSAS